MEKIVSTLPMLVISLPLYLVWLTAFILALVNWKKHPQVSALVVIGVCGLFVTSLISTYTNTWLIMTLVKERHMTYSQAGLYATVVGVVLSLITAGFWVLIVLAIFKGRNKQFTQNVQ